MSCRESAETFSSFLKENRITKKVWTYSQKLVYWSTEIKDPSLISSLNTLVLPVTQCQVRVWLQGALTFQTRLYDYDVESLLDVQPQNAARTEWILSPTCAIVLNLQNMGQGKCSGIQAGRAQRTYRSVEHYELQPGVKQKHAKLGDPSPPFWTHWSDHTDVSNLHTRCIHLVVNPAL